MIAVNGIILVLSCQKHLPTRVKHFKLPKNEYAGWKVIYVIGDLFLDCDYKFENEFLFVKCEDSYIHLLKKLVLSLKYLYQTFDIKEGVLRAGDDLLFNEDILVKFLNCYKYHKDGVRVIDSEGDGSDSSITEIDFLGRSPSGKNLLSHEISDADIKNTIRDTFMADYYMCHQEDFDNPQHNLKGVDICKYMMRPHIPVGPSGVIYYISNKACKILINHLENIGYNIFHHDEYTNSYPYTIEDCAVSFILYSNKISFIHCLALYEDYTNLKDKENDAKSLIAVHTNLNKY
uniref:Uncharacterized protein n=1 Tax=viral metagenome TaxID=1070528 RepID=A0A6C0LLY2_9ZZZZ